MIGEGDVAALVPTGGTGVGSAVKFRMAMKDTAPIKAIAIEAMTTVKFLRFLSVCFFSWTTGAFISRFCGAIVFVWLNVGIFGFCCLLFSFLNR